MRLLDSNIVIYSTQPAYDWLRIEISSQPFAISQATRIEVLGWHRLTLQDKTDLEAFLAAGSMLSITDAVADQAVIMRQGRKMSLGDSIIAATALERDLELVTRNVSDFTHVSGLKLWNPFDQAPAAQP